MFKVTKQEAMIKTVILLGITCIMSGCYFSVCSEIERIKESEIGAIITEKNTESSSHDVKYVAFDNKLSAQNDIYLSGERSGIWKYVMVGDSIYKPENTLNITVYKEGGQKSFQLKYNKNCN